MAGSMFRLSSDEVAPGKAMMQAAWNTPGAGYNEMAETLRPAVEHVLDLLPVHRGLKILDAATGTGIAAIEAAKRGATVTGIDFAPDLVAEARRAADASEIRDISFDVGDIEQLPYPDESFDAVVSTFGSIFAPRHDVVASELTRVLRPGGVLIFSSWKPQGPNLRLMTLMAPYVPPPPPTAFSVFDWGTPDYVESLLDSFCATITFAEGNVPWLASTPSDAIEMLFQRSLGPTVYLFNNFDAETRLKVHNDAIQLMASCLQPDGSVRLDRDYLITRAVKRG